MKKARIMLAVIAVLGLAGGTLAFKAQKFFTGSALYASGTSSCYLRTGFETTTTTVGVVGGFKVTTTVNPDLQFTYVYAPGKYCAEPINVTTALGE